MENGWNQFLVDAVIESTEREQKIAKLREEIREAKRGISARKSLKKTYETHQLAHLKSVVSELERLVFEWVFCPHDNRTYMVRISDIARFKQAMKEEDSTRWKELSITSRDPKRRDMWSLLDEELPWVGTNHDCQVKGVGNVCHNCSYKNYRSCCDGVGFDDARCGGGAVVSDDDTGGDTVDTHERAEDCAETVCEGGDSDKGAEQVATESECECADDYGFRDGITAPVGYFLFRYTNEDIFIRSEYDAYDPDSEFSKQDAHKVVTLLNDTWQTASVICANAGVYNVFQMGKYLRVGMRECGIVIAHNGPDANIHHAGTVLYRLGNPPKAEKALVAKVVDTIRQASRPMSSYAVYFAMGGVHYSIMRACIQAVREGLLEVDGQCAIWRVEYKYVQKHSSEDMLRDGEANHE